MIDDLFCNTGTPYPRGILQEGISDKAEALDSLYFINRSR